MSGDYTRFTHDPQKHYNRVLMQQGRVQLDADWNEAIEIIQDRLQKQAIDTFGRVAVSRFSTPSAFRVSVSGTNPNTTLALTPGRIYVDGLVAEILPDQSVTYTNQPFYPVPPALSSLTGNALIYLDVWEREVTYIEDPELLEPALGGPDTTTRIQTVWQVKVHSLGTAAATCTPNFATLFPASAGRLSSHAVNPPATTDPCILAPSGGFRGLENQLYRVEIHTPGGLGTARFKWSRDNASISANVQQITSVGGASQLTVSRIGRDRVLRFNVNDWVEITDDWRELMGEPGEMARIAAPPDEAAQTILLDRSIPTTGGRAFGANATELRSRHTRIRRWDQKAGTDANGLLTVTSSWTALEDGVEVDFSVVSTGGRFKIGDYWVFAARTADASVESLTNALPRGIEHHYAALATLTGLPTLNLQSDCRIIWFREGGGQGCCTVVVRPGESIQAAIDSLSSEGGCVCLKPGTHTITDPIWISRSNITLQGETLGARVMRENGVNLLAIAGTSKLTIENIIVENIHFETTGKAPAEVLQQVRPEALLDNGLISVVQSRDVIVRQCELVVISEAPPLSEVTIPIESIGIFIFKSQQITLYNNQVRSTTVGIWSEDSTNLKITRNLITGKSLRLGRTDADIIPLSLVGVLVDYQFVESTAGRQRKVNETCIIEQNQIEAVWIGIYLGSRAVESTIVGNTILRPSLGGLQLPVNRFFQILSPFLLATETFIYGIVSLARSCTIANNQITLNYGAYGGIRALGESTHIELNQLTANASPITFSPGGTAPPADLLPVGITLSSTIDKRFDDAPSYSTARSNTLKGTFSSGIWVIGVEQVRVIENQIQAELKAIPTFGISVFLTQSVFISKNQINNVQNTAIILTNTTGTQVVENCLNTGSWGVLAISDSSLEITQTTIENMRFAGIQGSNLRELTIIRQTQIISCGYAPPDATGVGAGIFVFNNPADSTVGANVGSLRVEACEILNTGISLDGKGLNKRINYGIAAGALRSCHILNNRVTYSDNYLTSKFPLDVNQESRALLLSGAPVVEPVGTIAKVERAIGSALISENLFSGMGFSHLVEVKRLTQAEIDLFKTNLWFEKITFNNNVCEHFVREKETNNQSTVSLWASYSIVTENHVKSSREGYPSINMNLVEDKTRRVVFMGNITSGSWINLGIHIPLPETSFNIQLS